MKWPVPYLLLATALTLASAIAPPSAVAGSGGAKAATGWTTMRLPAGVIRPAVLNGIAAAGPDLAWAVGTENLSGKAGPLLLHWDGTHWIKDPVPGGAKADEMVQVSSARPGTAWALGYLGNGSALIVRWIRHAWYRAPLPGNLDSQEIESIAGDTSGGAWLWGYGLHGYLLEHWYRGSWHPIKVPYDLWGGVEEMRSAGPDDLWLNDYTGQGVGIMAHYDAGTWTSTKPQSGGVSFISDFLAVTAKNLWVVGYLCTAAEPEAGCTSSLPQIAHWNGSAWNIVLHPKGVAYFTSISPARSGRPQWAGVSASGTSEPLLYAHFNGKTWSLEQAGARIRAAVMTWTAVAAVPGTDATWAIASRYANASEPGVTAIQYDPGR